MNFNVFFLSKFGTKLLAANNLIACERTEFDSEQKSSKFMRVITTLVLSFNNIGSDIEFILMSRSFVYSMNNRGPEIDPWGT